jgi:hypothetical protein
MLTRYEEYNLASVYHGENLMNDINVTKITCPICNEEKCYEDTHIDENGQFIVKE